MAPIREWFGVYNVIYNWIEEKYGYEELEAYWEHIADSCYGEAAEIFKKEGLTGIKNYYETIFKLDEGECRCYQEGEQRIELQIIKCPDQEFLKSSVNEYFRSRKNYCRHHAVINARLAEKSGYKFNMVECDNNGKCKWVFELDERNGLVII